MNFDKWKSRCHSLGYLMTEPKGKSNLQKHVEACASYDEKFAKWQSTVNKETKTAIKMYDDCMKLAVTIEKLAPLVFLPNLSTACKTKLAEIYTNETTGRHKVISSAYLEKGLEVEEDSITMFSLYTGNFYKKNPQEQSNEFIVGTCDFESAEEDLIVDTKSSWDIFTFDKTKFAKINPLYEWQAQAYMWLWNRKNFKLAYCLNDTPKRLVDANIKKFMYEIFGSENNYVNSSDEDKAEFEIACNEIRKNHSYPDLPLDRKIKIFDIKRDDEKIDRIKTRIPECREYLNNIETNEEETVED